MAYRDHEPIRIEKFNGLWKRGDQESCPLDHATEAKNIVYFPDGVKTREGLTIFDLGEENFITAVRMYTFTKQNVDRLLILDTLGNIFDTGSPTPGVAILSIATMTDFAFQGIAGRAYISPNDGELGLENEFVYVYLGDGNPARKAAGNPPTTAPVLALGGTLDVEVETGWHVFGVVYETDTGYRTQIGPLAAIQATGAHQIDLSAIPVSPDSFVVARHIVASKAIDPVLYTGDNSQYQLFFLPDGRIDDNITTTFTANFYDADLVSDASHLEDLYAEIPAGVFLGLYHDRLLVGGIFGEANANPDLDTYALTSTVLVSVQGEPEAFDQVDGLIVAPLDDMFVSNAQEYRDILYVFKNTKTYAYTDNNDVPSTWIPVTLDQGLGASIHGIATVLDSGGTSIDYLVIANFSGICIFNGSFIDPELSWKIEGDWSALDQDLFNLIQVLNDPISKMIYAVLQTGQILFGDYSEGLDQMKVKWGYWESDARFTTIAIINTNQLAIGSSGLLNP